jgi:hypothetical protein
VKGNPVDPSRAEIEKAIRKLRRKDATLSGKGLLQRLQQCGWSNVTIADVRSVLAIMASEVGSRRLPSQQSSSGGVGKVRSRKRKRDFPPGRVPSGTPAPRSEICPSCGVAISAFLGTCRCS